MNKVLLIGRTTKDMDMKMASKDTAYVKFALAVPRIANDETDFIQCVAFGRTAEVLSEYVKKGMRIAVEGCIQTGSYDGRDGKKVYTTDVYVNRFEFCDAKSDDAANNATVKSSYSRGGRR